MAGRPRTNIDKTAFEKLCGLMCTLDEIAGFFSCSEDTIERWCKREYNQSFREVYEAKSVIGKISLRRAQFKLAEKNATLLIFLGKNYLGQTDDPRRYAREETTEDKLDRLLDTINAALDSGDDDDKS